MKRFFLFAQKLLLAVWAISVCGMILGCLGLSVCLVVVLGNGLLDFLKAPIGMKELPTPAIVGLAELAFLPALALGVLSFLLFIVSASLMDRVEQKIDQNINQ